MQLFWLGIFWLAGISLGLNLPFPSWVWFLLTACTFTAAFTILRPFRSRRIVLGLGFACLAGARSHATLPVFGAEHIGSYNDLPFPVSIQGVIVDFPEEREHYTGLRVRIENAHSVELGSHLIQDGLVLVHSDPLTKWHYGDRLYARGYLETPPEFEGFSYRDYLARQGIFSLMQRAEVSFLAADQANPLLQLIFSFRERSLEVIYLLFPNPEASLLSGILLGIESGIHPAVQDAFNRTGTTHIIAISGFNLTIISAGVISLCQRGLGSRWGTALAGVTIAIYTVFVGGDPAVVRAAIMGGVALYARQIGRQTHGLASLSLSALLMTLLKPDTLWDIGFQLSFSATLGLILYGEGLNRWLKQHLTTILGETLASRAGGPIYEFGLITLAAQLTTLPLTILYFQRLPVISLIANPVILPFQPGLMVLGGLATLLGVLWLPLGKPVAAVAWFFPAITIRWVEFFAALPFASYELGRVSLLWVVLYYALLFSLTLLPRTALPELQRFLASLKTHLPKTTTLLALTLLVGVIWKGDLDRPDGRFHILVLEVEGGEAVLLQSPSGRFLLVNGGSSEIQLSDALGRYLPLTNRTLDWLVLSGSREEQIRGILDLIPRLKVHGALTAGLPRSAAYQKLLETLHAHGTPVHPFEIGRSLHLGEGARLTVLEQGDFGICLEVSYGRSSILLLPGMDPEMAARMDLQTPPVNLTAVLLADGGSLAVNPMRWLERAQPRLLLLSVPREKRPDQPSLELLQTFQTQTVLRTDHHGTIHLTTDGISLGLEVERPGVEEADRND